MLSVQPEPTRQEPEYPPERINFAFSYDGSAAACLTSLGPRQVVLEYYEFGAEPAPAVRVPVSGPASFVLPAPDRQLLLARPAGANRVEFVLVRADSTGEVVTSLGEIECQKLRLWSTPDPDTLAVVTGRSGDTEGGVWRIDAAPPGVHQVAELPGLQLVGGGWLDGAGRWFAVNRKDDTGRSVPVSVPVRGPAPRELTGNPTGNEVLQVSRAGLTLLATDASGQFRFGVGRAGADGTLGELAFPACLDEIDGAVLPLTADAAGERIALHVGRGVRSHVVIYDVGSGECTELGLPLGTLSGPAQFGKDGSTEVLRMAFCTPDQPAELLTVPLDGSGEPYFVPTTAATRSAPMRVALRAFDGPEGTVEAIVYGQQDLRSAKQILIALHGGPEDAWRPRFDLLFQRLVATGLGHVPRISPSRAEISADELQGGGGAHIGHMGDDDNAADRRAGSAQQVAGSAGHALSIVAPNQRGSTHYGAAHRDAIRGAWGGPDLADIQHLARHLATEAPDADLLLYGLSYGAYLALLTAGVEPLLWRRCVAVAPFLSGPRLYPEASDSVRKLLDRLDGCTEIEDRTGPRDVLRFAHQITADLLVVHGTEDTTIPVGQSRALAEHMWTAEDGVGEFGYLEIPGEGHYPLYAPDGASVHQQITEFLLTGSFPSGARAQRAAAGG